MNQRIAMIGGGNMAGALVAGLVANRVDPSLIDVLDRNQDKCDLLSEKYGVNTYLSVGDWLGKAQIVVLAVKPQGMFETIESIRSYLNENVLFISIAAGLRIADLTRWLHSDHLVRAMPNTPALVKAGVVGVYMPASLSSADQAAAKEVLQVMGEIIPVSSEMQLDLLSTVSGSGPAYVFRFIEALEAAVVKRGFDPVQARRMAILTVLGAGKLAIASDEPPAKLRANVTSKGGTTAEALRVMDEHHFMDMMDEAIQAAYDRNQVLADQLGQR